MLKVKDIMTKEVISTTAESSIKDAAEVMYMNHLTGLPVLDNDDKLVGILTDTDLVKQEKGVDLPVMFGLLGSYVYLDNPANGDEVEKQLKEITAVKVGELMEKQVVTAAPDMPLEELAGILVHKKVNPVPVMEDGKLVGIVSRADIVKLIADPKGGSLPVETNN